MKLTKGHWTQTHPRHNLEVELCHWLERIGQPPLPPRCLATAHRCPVRSWIGWSLECCNFSHRCQWLPEVRYSSLPMLQPRPPAFQKMYLERQILVRADHHRHHNHHHCQCHHYHHHCQPILGGMLENRPPRSPFNKVRRRETEIHMLMMSIRIHQSGTL